VLKRQARLDDNFIALSMDYERIVVYGIIPAKATAAENEYSFFSRILAPIKALPPMIHDHLRSMRYTPFFLQNFSVFIKNSCDDKGEPRQYSAIHGVFLTTARNDSISALTFSRAPLKDQCPASGTVTSLNPFSNHGWSPSTILGEKYSSFSPQMIRLGTVCTNPAVVKFSPYGASGKFSS
jgi:hypothetical protein